jgi:hypothetical protein
MDHDLSIKVELVDDNQHEGMIIRTTFTNDTTVKYMTCGTNPLCNDESKTISCGMGKAKEITW